MSVSSNSYDAIIVGGGPAGTSAAIHLAASGARVLLVEQKKFPRAKLCGEFISPECLEHFRRLGISESIGQAGGALLTETRFYSRAGTSISVPSEWFGAGQSLALGLSRAEMDERLMLRARDAGVLVLEDARATGLLMDAGRVRGVRLKAGEEASEYSALVTIDATGRAHALSRHMQIAGRNGAKARRAPLVAFKAHLSGARGDQQHCEIYSYRGGYGGLNQVERGLSNLCFIVTARDARACNSDAGRLMREIVMTNRRARLTLAEAHPVTEWLGVALESFGRREVAPADGLLAVGDAASFIDPFTGSGMLMALESGELAARTVAGWLERAGSLDSLAALTKEYRARYSERFRARLRVCSVLRRAAFVPRLAEAAIVALGASDSVRRLLARATRRRPASLRGEGRAET